MSKSMHTFESKEEYFIKNGGLLLEKLLALSRGQDIVGQMKILSQKEIKNATNNYDPNLITNRIYEANIYKGTLDDRTIKWSGRLAVAIQIAYALSYMHNALSKPMVHRDVNSSSILVDSAFQDTALVNLAHSVSISPGKKNQKWPVHGTPGYIDPEYIETQEVTDKCDVYSFGVLMLELLTTREPDGMSRCGKDLVIEFVSEVERNGDINESIDTTVLEEGNMGEIQRFAQLALRCVAKKGEERPTMINVVEVLRQIQDQNNNECGCKA